MLDDFINPRIEQVDIVLIEKATIAWIEREITACEDCYSETEIPLDWVLYKITGHQGPTTDYLLEIPAHCQRCGREMTEKTLVEWSGTDRYL